MDEPYRKDEHFANREPFPPYYEPPAAPPAPPKHGGLGIASFVLSLVGIVSFVVLTIVLIGFFLGSVDYANVVDDNGNLLLTEEQLLDKMRPLLGYLVFYPLLLLLVAVGLILGIVGLTRPGTKKVFAVLGTVFSGLPLLFIVLLFLVGLAVA